MCVSFNVVRQNVALSRSPVISGEMVQQSLANTPASLHPLRIPGMSSRAITCHRFCRSRWAMWSQAARLAKRNRTDFFKLCSRGTN